MLSAQETANIRIEAIEVRYAKQVQIFWPSAEQAYLNTVPEDVKKKIKVERVNRPLDNNADDGKRAVLLACPEGRAFIRKQLSNTVNQHLQDKVVYHFKDSRGAILELEVIIFAIPSAAQRLMIGGNPTFGAITYLKDAQTGEVLGKLDRGSAAAAGQGIAGVLVEQALGPLETRVLDVYSSQVLLWLKTPAKS